MKLEKRAMLKSSLKPIAIFRVLHIIFHLKVARISVRNISNEDKINKILDWFEMITKTEL